MLRLIAHAHGSRALVGSMAGWGARGPGWTGPGADAVDASCARDVPLGTRREAGWALGR